MPRNVTVQFADGTTHVYRNAPDDLTPDMVQARAQKEFGKPVAGLDGGRTQRPAAPPAPKNKSAWDGFVAGLAQTVDAPFRWIDSVNPYAKKEKLSTETDAAYRARLAEVNRSEQSRAKNKAMLGNNTRTGWQTTGKIVGSLPTALITQNPWLSGAMQGAMVSDKQDVGGILGDAAIGAVSGKVGDVVGKRVIAPAAARIGNTAPVKAAARAIAKKTGMFGSSYAPTPVLTRAEKVIAKASPETEQVIAKLEQAKRLGLPYGLADATSKTRSLAGSVSRMSPEARQIAEERFLPRAEGQAERAISAVKTHLAAPDNIEVRTNGLHDAANAFSNPLYEKSFQGGSMAPLEDQLTTAFNQSSKAVKEAAQELASAQNAATLSKASVSNAGENVYLNARALPNDRAAASAIAAAQAKLDAATANHEQVLSALRQSQHDAATNAPGAIWSPRIQQFLDDPIGKPGMASGIETQRLESLAQGKPFNPTEYAIKGFDEAGQPIIANVPNMRTLDAYKKGLDRMIEAETDVSGRVSQKGRALIQVKNSMLGELDTANPDYQAARGEYAKWMQSKDAFLKGVDSTDLGTSAEDVANNISVYSPAQMNEYRTGTATQLIRDAAKATDGSNPWNRIYGSIDKREKLGNTFSPEGVNNFKDIFGLERDMSKTAYETLGGSPTQARAMADQLLQDKINPAALAGAATNPKGAVLRAILQKGSDHLATRGEKTAAELAPILYNTNPDDALKFLQEYVKRQAAINAQRRGYGGLFGRSAVPAILAIDSGSFSQ